jgi:hypothetical protein
MRNVTTSLRHALLPLIIAGCFAPGAHAGWLDWKTSAPGEKIQFSGAESSDTNTTTTVSNAAPSAATVANPLNPGVFGQMKEQIFGPLEQSLKNVNSTRGVMDLPPPQAPPPADRRTREMIDRQRNWAFAAMEDLDSETNGQDALGVKSLNADGKDSQSTSLVDKYYNKSALNPAQTRQQWNGTFDAAGGKGFSRTNEWGATTPLQNVDSFSKGWFSSGQDSTGLNRDLSGFKADSVADLNSPEMQAAKKHSEDFQRILSPSLPSVPTLNNSIPGLADVNRNNAQTPNAAFKFPAPEPYRSIVNPMVGVVDPNIAALHSHVYDDPTAASLGLPNPVAAKVPVKPPTAQSVQQMLDPFSASVVKPRF